MSVWIGLDAEFYGPKFPDPKDKLPRVRLHADFMYWRDPETKKIVDQIKEAGQMYRPRALPIEVEARSVERGEGGFALYGAALTAGLWVEMVADAQKNNCVFDYSQLHKGHLAFRPPLVAGVVRDRGYAQFKRFNSTVVLPIVLDVFNVMLEPVIGG